MAQSALLFFMCDRFVVLSHSLSHVSSSCIPGLAQPDIQKFYPGRQRVCGGASHATGSPTTIRRSSSLSKSAVEPPLHRSHHIKSNRSNSSNHGLSSRTHTECNTSPSRRKYRITLFQAARDLTIVSFCFERISIANDGGATAKALWPLRQVSALLQRSRLCE